MSPEEKLAIAKILEAEAKQEREDIDPGEYKIKDLYFLDVNARVNVRENEKYTPTVSIPLKSTLALFMQYTGVTGDHAVRALQQAMTDALEQKEKGDKAVKNKVKEVENVEKKVKEQVTSKLPKKDRKGAVSVEGTVLECKSVDVSEKQRKNKSSK